MRPKCLLKFCCVLALISGCSNKAKTQFPDTTKGKPAASFFSVDPATAGTVTGTVRVTGKVTVPKSIDMSEDPACVEAHHGKPHDESLIVSRKGALANAFVYVRSGLEGKNFKPPVAPVIIEQSGCWFRPRVIGIQTGQVLKVINSDPVTHNIHPMAHINREWNHSQAAGDPPITRTFTYSEIMIPVKCNIHSWMHVFIGVLNHPYFIVSGSNGSFEIKNLPPGTYTIAVWQEKLGTQERQVTVSPLSKIKVDFTFKGK